MFIGVMLACALSTTSPDYHSCTLETSKWRIWLTPSPVSQEECETSLREVLKNIIAPNIESVLNEIPGYDAKNSPVYSFTFKCYEEKQGLEQQKQYPDLYKEDAPASKEPQELKPDDFLNK